MADRKTSAEVILAKSAGFCFGVERAVNRVYEEISKGGSIYTYGPIIHNKEVVSDLESRGVRVVETPEDIKKIDHGTVVIRSHGVSRETDRLIRESGLSCVDATCPFVKRIHRTVEAESAAGKHIVIVGNPVHPEVIGIMGWSSTPVTVIQSPEDIQKLDDFRNSELCVVAQTTFNAKKFQDLVDILEKKEYNVLCVNTICNATHERQSEARSIAARADIMIVIGDSSSSNSAKLYEICRKECARTFFIQTWNDLHLTLTGAEKVIGITAGASTPKNIIEEVYAEYTNDHSVDLTEVLHVGDKLEVKILKVNDGDGQVVLSYKRLAADRGNKRIEEAYKNKEVLTAKVTQVLSGGLSVVVEEVRVFIPASLVSDTFERDLSKYLGQDIEFVITEYNPNRRRYIGDRKQLLVEKRKEMQRKLFETIHPGDTVEGTVKNITDFGAFIDLGGADGLLHISEMSWGRVENPKKVFKVGEQLRVLIKDIQGTKIALSLKFPEENPWVGAAEKYAVGTVVTGRVARMTDFGAFVELEPGIDALLHVSQIAREHIDKPSDVLKTGQEVTAKIVDFNQDSNKISLSVKQLLIDKERERRAAERANADADVSDVDVAAFVKAQRDKEGAEDEE